MKNPEEKIISRKLILDVKQKNQSFSLTFALISHIYLGEE
jgi:hypothetical protein